MNKGSLVLFASALGVSWIGGSGCQTHPAGTPGESQQFVSVQTLSAERASLQRKTTQPAAVHAWFEARIFAKASGYVSELNVDIGAVVKGNQVLAVIAIPEMEKQREAKWAEITRLEKNEQRAGAQLKVAEANADSYHAKLAKAKADVAKSVAALTAINIEHRRVTELVKQKAVADRLLDEATKKLESAQADKTAAEAGVTAASAELALSKAQTDAAHADVGVAEAMTDVARREVDELDELMEYAQLRSPFDGLVTERHVDPGDLALNTQAGSRMDSPPLFVIARLDKVRVRVSVPERDAPLASVGDEATVTLQALPGEVFRGAVSRLSGVLDESTRTMLVEIDLPNDHRRLLPGMFGQATIALESPGEKLSLPADVVRYDEHGNSYVYAVNAADEVEVVQVETGLDNGRQVEISAGLTGSERIIGPVLRRLKPGQKVRIDG